jgi:hypothetical protein
MKNKIQIQFSPTRLKQIKKIALSGSKAKLKILNGKLEEGFHLLKNTAQKLQSFSADLARQIPNILAKKVSLGLFSHFESKNSKKLGIPKGLVLGGALALMTSLPAMGQVFIDAPTTTDLVNAINTANGNAADHVIRLDEGQTYTLTANLPTVANNGTLSVICTGTINAIVDGDNSFRPFTMASNSNLTITKITIQNGLAANSNGGAVTKGNGTLTINDCLITSNLATSSGAGQGRGGAIFSFGSGELSINNSIITGNQSSSAGGTSGRGGAIYNRGNLTIQSSTISFNSAATHGGAFFANNGGSFIQILNSSLINNTCNSSGGAFFSQYNPVTISNSTISGNTSNGNGGGIYNRYSGAPLTISSSTISNNSGSRGGGIHHANNTLNIQASSITSNQSTNQGGGIYLQENGTDAISITNSTISSNNSTGNTGGGIYNKSTGAANTLTLQHVTLFDNTGVGTDGFANTGATDITVQNTIIDDCSGTGLDFSLGGGTLNGASTNNIVQDGSMGGAMAVHSLLDPLTLNSGSMINPMPIGSPAIAGGANLGIITDQVGNPRGATPSIGAVEVTVPGACMVVAAPAGVTNSWIGCTNTDWQTASNWSANCVPKETDIVYVPQGTANELIIDEIAVCAKMLVQIGAKCKVDFNVGGKLLVKFQ